MANASDLANQPAYEGDKGDGAPVDPATIVRYSYTSTTACTMAPPGLPAADTLCAYAVTACTNPADSPGPLVRIWRQGTKNGAVVEPWLMIGVTCHADVAPNARPMLTMAMIQQAFHLTPWASASVGVEPANNVTLVGLDTYYQVIWSAEGFEPGEVDPIDPGRMLGYQVDIRPKLVGYVYRFGDGSEFGPTPLPGGVYPTGTITHQYRSTGTVPVNVSVMIGADFRVGGGDWAPIPDTVTLQGPVTQVQVKAARAVLVQR